MQNLDRNVKIVNEDGTPTEFFMRILQDRGVGQDDNTAVINAFKNNRIVGGTGLHVTGSGKLTDGNVTLTPEIQTLLDEISSVRGSVLFRGAANWEALAPGSAGKYLKTTGAGADPMWDTPSGGGGGTTLDFTTGSLPAGVTYSGGTNGTRVNSSGVLVAASGARFDYDPVTLASLGILCEPARTNVIGNTEDFTAWQQIYSVTTTANTDVAPDGATTADSIALTSSAGFIRKFEVPWTDGVQGAFSAYLKSATGSAAIYLTTNNTNAWGTGLSTKMSPTTTWNRFSIHGSLGTGFSKIHAMMGNIDGSGSADGSIPTETIVGWGAQLEVMLAGERQEASTYIPSSGGGTTRAADVISFTIPSGISSLVYTFDDNSTQTVSVSAGSYTVPTNLNRARIKTIKMVAPTSGGTLIESHAFTGSENSFTFSTIPTGFKYLEIVITGRIEATGEDDAVLLRFNGDTGSNYAYNQEFSNPSWTYVDTASNTFIDVARLPGNGSPSSAQQAGGGTIKLFNYDNSNFYTDTLSSGSSFSGATSSRRRQMFASGIWRNTAVLTSIQVFSLTTSNFTAGSVVSLYGY